MKKINLLNFLLLNIAFAGAGASGWNHPGYPDPVGGEISVVFWIILIIIGIIWYISV